MKVLVTGGAGFIGSHIADALRRSGHRVIVVDDLSSGREENLPTECEFYRLSVAEPWLERVMRRERPDAVIHQAAQIDVRHSVADPAFDARVNVLGTVNVALAAAAAGAGTLIFASTGGAIYGDTANVPTGEDEPPLPSSPYGAAKLAGEHYLRVLAQLHGFRWVALRYTNVYGPRQDPHGEAGVVAIFSERLLEGRETVIYGNGEQTRDYVYVGDVARANLLALESGVSGAYNVGTGSETTVNRLHSLIAGAAGSPEARAAHAPARPGEQSRSAVDASRAARDLGWRPETDLAAGLQETVAFFRQRQVARV